MNVPQLQYAGPKTPKWTPKPSPWLVAGASVALLFFLVEILPFTPSSVGNTIQAKIAATGVTRTMPTLTISIIRGRSKLATRSSPFMSIRPIAKG